MFSKTNTVLAGAVLAVASLSVSACSGEPSSQDGADVEVSRDLSPAVATLEGLSIIPAPASISPGHGQFVVTNTVRVEVAGDDAEALSVAEYFVSLTARTTRFDFEVVTLGAGERSQGGIVFARDNRASGASVQDAYTLIVDDNGVRLSADEGAGLLNAATTLWQMLTSVESDGGAVTLPAVTIEDAPRYAWRGLMLDSARHYQSTDYIKQFIDWMAVHKFNVFHWHLIDDQGWRLEIKKYPRLTSVGAYRVQQGEAAQADIDPATGEPRIYGGFYSQDEVRDIVAYAAERHITVIPEIEMPGHAQALLVAYPEYSVTGEEIELRTDWGIFPHLYNVEEETFDFIEDVLTEVMDLFPSTYIHIGGDEAVKDQWEASARVQERMSEFGVEDEEELQSYFVRRVETFLNQNGRKLVGWDEILEGGLSPNATVMSWRGEAGGIEAAKQGHDVVMTPGPLLYFDFEQSSLRDEPPGRPEPNVQTLEDIYIYNPKPDELTAEEASHILGIQANIWTEHMRLQERVTHMSFPRAAAVSEIAWTDGTTKDFNAFLERLTVQLRRYETLGIAYADSAFQVDMKAKRAAIDDMVSIELDNQTGFGNIH
ncbi:MAG: beta-N-acetylhexosaminidase, partial [Pseudomonadota bacterium]